MRYSSIQSVGSALLVASRSRTDRIRFPSLSVTKLSWHPSFHRALSFIFSFSWFPLLFVICNTHLTAISATDLRAQADGQANQNQDQVESKDGGASPFLLLITLFISGRLPTNVLLLSDRDCTIISISQASKQSIIALNRLINRNPLGLNDADNTLLSRPCRRCYLRNCIRSYPQVR